MSLKSQLFKMRDDWKEKHLEKLMRESIRKCDEEDYIRLHKHEPEFLKSIGNTSYKPQKENTDLFLSDIMTNKKRRF